ncbi:winged helix-turn-helix transcriptional regulator [Mesorhizobium sp. CU2]|uniref:GntR family transcriptional regulator n=1 Tax=unclassified Mesorhizobium TaxID=325217 RepID=UPI0011265610|nr:MULTISPECIES: winged helix-turn-helix domain-containing protein [unclassified Mesorhizobium]TPN80646.1 winged helix-turn-helix transcriptional regulator [Mesorhizobium sp. CU3]TPO21854.1 winged helix-turn-helix transcriptional regulator [Mesorhizobium sp. CU2]
MASLPIDLDRAARAPLATQVHKAVRDAIETGRLDPGAKLPSCRDMAAQLGVSRGTVRVAYQRLVDEQFAVGAGAAGKRAVRQAHPGDRPGQVACGALPRCAREAPATTVDWMFLGTVLAGWLAQYLIAG